MSRNFGLGSRVMADAGRIALHRLRAAKGCSFNTARHTAGLWAMFCQWLKTHGINRMEHITRDHLIAYGKELAEMVLDEEIESSTAHGKVSAVNSVMRQALGKKWKSVGAVSDCNIKKRQTLRISPTPRASEVDAAVKNMRELGCHRTALIAELCFYLGLRSKEASLLNSKRALQELRVTGLISIERGTKGGRKRTIKISEKAAQVLEDAANFQGNFDNLIPSDLSWKKWRDGELRRGRELLKSAGFKGYHDLRSGYASERYIDITGFLPPCFGVKIGNKAADLEARKLISTELGHSRIQICGAYFGGRR